jgi:hypothetical protein
VRKSPYATHRPWSSTPVFDREEEQEPMTDTSTRREEVLHSGGGAHAAPGQAGWPQHPGRRGAAVVMVAPQSRL